MHLGHDIRNSTVRKVNRGTVRVTDYCLIYRHNVMGAMRWAWRLSVHSERIESDMRLSNSTKQNGKYKCHIDALKTSCWLVKKRRVKWTNKQSLWKRASTKNACNSSILMREKRNHVSLVTKEQHEWEYKCNSSELRKCLLQGEHVSHFTRAHGQWEANDALTQLPSAEEADDFCRVMMAHWPSLMYQEWSKCYFSLQCYFINK